MDSVELENKEGAAFGEIWLSIIAIAEKEGVTPLNRLSEAYLLEAGDWMLWINGTGADLSRTDAHPPIPRFNCYATFNGWPAGLFDPHGGTIAAGRIANVFTLRDALAAKVREMPEART